MPLSVLSSEVAALPHALRSVRNCCHAASRAARNVLRALAIASPYVFHAFLSAARRAVRSAMSHAARSAVLRAMSAVFAESWSASNAAMIAVSRFSTALFMHAISRGEMTAAGLTRSRVDVAFVEVALSVASTGNAASVNKATNNDALMNFCVICIK